MNNQGDLFYSDRRFDSGNPDFCPALSTKDVKSLMDQGLNVSYDIGHVSPRHESPSRLLTVRRTAFPALLFRQFRLSDSTVCIDSMDPIQLRQRICFDAAQLLLGRRVNNYHDARWKAARSITRSYLPAECLPTDVEIRANLQHLMGSGHIFSVTVPDRNTAGDDNLPDSRFEHYLALLLPLDRVIQSKDTHPEGDVLYHCLQVFELTHETHPWDEELLTAAVMHDVGKGIDPRDSHHAGLVALAGFVTERTRWLIENLPSVHRVFEGTLGIRARRRLAASESWEELETLAAHDREGRVPGRSVRSPEAAIEVLRNLSTE